MDLYPFYSWICFVFCLGLTAGGALVVFRQAGHQRPASFRYLQYYLILMYTFGFYALWSQLLFRSLFLSVLKKDNQTPLAEFIVLLSVPFLLVGLLMLVLWTSHVLKKPSRTYWYSFLISLALGVLLVYGGYGSSWSLYQVYAACMLLVMAYVSTQLVLAEVELLDRMPRLVLATLSVLLGALHIPLLVGVQVPVFFELVFIVLFFLIHTVFVVYYVYQARFSRIDTPGVASSRPVLSPGGAGELIQDPAFERFIVIYEITPREAEVIREIYYGKTNREIADKLFVTIQTIKDHTHRIYQKTNVKSRTQLASLLRSFRHPA